MNQNILEFYVSKINYLSDTSQTDVSCVPSLMRRRLSEVDKAAVDVMNKTYTDVIQYILFSSQYGEAERLFKLIEQYSTEKEVSPNIFSGSVHNYPAGFFLLNSKHSIPYNAIAACDNSISIGLLSSVISQYEHVLFCYSDIIENKPYAFAVNIHKQPLEESKKYRIIMGNNSETNDFYSEYIKLFCGSINKIFTPFFIIESCASNE